MIYSKTCEYAIRALSYLAAKKSKMPATIREVHAETDVPQAYVAKIFQCLSHSKIVDSKSGPNGGYFLKVDPDKLTLLQIINALDDISESPLSNCVMGQTECNDKNPCCLHPIWAKARKQMSGKLAKETILNAGKSKKRVYRNQNGRTVLSKHMQRVFGYSTS